MSGSQRSLARTDDLLLIRSLGLMRSGDRPPNMLYEPIKGGHLEFHNPDRIPEPFEPFEPFFTHVHV
jgi:hypothetical protein